MNDQTTKKMYVTAVRLPLAFAPSRHIGRLGARAPHFRRGASVEAVFPNGSAREEGPQSVVVPGTRRAISTCRGGEGRPTRRRSPGTRGASLKSHARFADRGTLDLCDSPPAQADRHSLPAGQAEHPPTTAGMSVMRVVLRPLARRAASRPATTAQQRGHSSMLRGRGGTHMGSWLDPAGGGARGVCGALIGANLGVYVRRLLRPRSCCAAVAPAPLLPYPPLPVASLPLFLSQVRPLAAAGPVRPPHEPKLCAQHVVGGAASLDARHPRVLGAWCAGGTVPARALSHRPPPHSTKTGGTCSGTA